uniref:Reverse transcriptase domain-containing protein n=1 Tax=Labrus bergylta TaxID=56723 RepID=A0A3Q3GSZ6_9LABR
MQFLDQTRSLIRSWTVPAARGCSFAWGLFSPASHTQTLLNGHLRKNATRKLNYRVMRPQTSGHTLRKQKLSLDDERNQVLLSMNGISFMFPHHMTEAADLPQKTKDLSTFLSANSTARLVSQSDECLSTTAAADFQAAIDKLRTENLELLANFQKECGAAISALQQVVDVHGKKIQDVEESLTDANDQLLGLGETVTQLSKENEAMKKQLDYLSNYTRRENISIIGLPESAEMPESANFVSNLLREVFGPNAFEMPIITDRAHWTAGPRPSAGDRPRPLLVRMHSYRVRELVLRLASCHEGLILYQGKRIHFFPDVSPEVARLRSSFTAVKGTRQGCPLSPLLFAIAIEPLAIAIRQNDKIEGIFRGGQTHRVSLYADNLLLFITNPDTTLPHVFSLLDAFGAISSYKLNLHKSEYFPLTLLPPPK